MNIKNNFVLLLAVLLFVATLSPRVAHAQADPETEIQDTNQEPEAAELQIQEIKIDDDELPGESVTPKTDVDSSVINRKVNLKKRFALDLATGSILDEPLLNSNYILFRASYYVDESLAFGLGFKSRFGGQTSYAEQLAAGTAQLKFDRAPSPTQSHFLSTSYSFYYGKLSFAKDTVVTATTRLDGDIGMQKVGTSNKPFMQTALTQSFYLNKYVAIGLSLGISMAQTLDSTSVNIRATEPVPSESAFAEKSQFNQYLSANLTLIL